MTDNRRRHDRIPADEAASIEAGAATVGGRVTDISDSGAAVEFNLAGGESRIQFDLGERVAVASEQLQRQSGRVVRQYEGGFAMNFDADGYGLKPKD